MEAKYNRSLLVRLTQDFPSYDYLSQLWDSVAGDAKSIPLSFAKQLKREKGRFVLIGYGTVLFTATPSFVQLGNYARSVVTQSAFAYFQHHFTRLDGFSLRPGDVYTAAHRPTDLADGERLECFVRDAWRFLQAFYEPTGWVASWRLYTDEAGLPRRVILQGLAPTSGLDFEAWVVRYVKRAGLQLPPLRHRLEERFPSAWPQSHSELAVLRRSCVDVC
ncbi:MAG: hypothetical protein NZ482_03625 [Gloeomargarita sp. SKYG98]|nr:hypothetical protein [Gloeomargarita sp. SKYG98]